MQLRACLEQKRPGLLKNASVRVESQSGIKTAVVTIFTDTDEAKVAAAVPDIKQVLDTANWEPYVAYKAQSIIEDLAAAAARRLLNDTPSEDDKAKQELHLARVWSESLQTAIASYRIAAVPSGYEILPAADSYVKRVVVSFKFGDVEITDTTAYEHIHNQIADKDRWGRLVEDVARLIIAQANNADTLELLPDEPPVVKDMGPPEITIPAPAMYGMSFAQTPVTYVELAERFYRSLGQALDTTFKVHYDHFTYSQMRVSGVDKVIISIDCGAGLFKMDFAMLFFRDDWGKHPAWDTAINTAAMTLINAVTADYVARAAIPVAVDDDGSAPIPIKI